MSHNIAKSLESALADSYVLFLKTQNFHWNVTGPNFKSLHLMFEEQYNDLFLAVDLIAERIRALGSKAPANFSKYNKLTKIKDGNEELSANLMVKELASDQKVIIKTLTKVLQESQHIGDEVTAEIMTDRIKAHEKNAWMLNSSLE